MHGMTQYHKGCLKPLGKDCPLCKKLAQPTYRRALRYLMGEKPQRNHVHRISLPCEHRGPELRQEPCVDCVHQKVSVTACTIKGECTLNKLVRGADGRYLPMCQECSDRKIPSPK